MEHVEDVVIVGGGPAGAYCAFELAKKNIHATILDHSHPREKPCGGGISSEVLEKFPFTQRFGSKGNSSPDFKIILLNNKQVVTKRLKRGFNISRQYFDKEILDMATKNGAKLVEEKVLEVRKKENFWNIKTNKQVINGKILVGADGVNSLVRRRIIGAIPKEDLALTYGYLATGVEKEPSTVKFLAEIPSYIWIFPRKNHSSIGISGELKHGNKLKKLLDDFINSYCPQIKVITEFAAMLPSATDPCFFNLPCAGVDWVLLGDAAGHVDPLSGEGILYALWSATIAAEKIAEKDLESYDCRWRKAYGDALMARCRIKSAYDPAMIALSLLLNFSRK